MDGRIRSTIAVILFIITIILGYIRLFFPVKTRKHKFIEKAEAQGNHTTGTCIKSKRIRGNDESSGSNKHDRYKITYEYIVNGISYTKNVVFQCPGISPDYPYTITIYYNPNKPQKAVCKEDIDIGLHRNLGCLWTFVIGVIVFQLAYHLLKLL